MNEKPGLSAAVVFALIGVGMIVVGMLDLAEVVVLKSRAGGGTPLLVVGPLILFAALIFARSRIR